MNHVPWPAWVSGMLLAPAVAYVAFRARSLSGSGAFAAALVGAAAMAAGWSWGALIIAYFVSSSALSRYRAADKAARTMGRVDKGGARDAAQVFANGGIVALLAVAFAITQEPIWQALAAGALAASAADTWATEIGVLSAAAPRAILGWEPVPPGTSGGVTPLGFGAGAAGAAMVTIAAAALRWPPAAVVAAFTGGIAGCVVDSIVGGTLQSRRMCPTCGATTEQRIHSCGTATTHSGGIAWLDNDGVNGVATLTGALFGASLASLV